MFIAGIPRPFSLLASPACLADLMIFAIVTSYSLFLMTKGASRFLYLAGVPVMVYALLLTSVRTNWMGLIAGIVFWFIIARRSSLRLKAVMIAAVLAFSFFGNMAADTFFTPKEDGQAIPAVAAPKAAQGAKGITDVFVKERMSTMTSPFQEHSMISRFEMWKTIIQHSLLWLPQGPFGWGMGSFDAHSYYFSILSDTGYPGLFLLLFLLFRIFMIGFKVYGGEEDDNRRVLVRGIIVILFLISFMNLTGLHVGSHPADIYYWFFAGLLMIFRRLKGDVPLTAAARRTPLNDPT
jgi:O-antigen ligase